MAAKVKAWVWVVVAVVVLGIVGIIAMAAAGMYFFTRHIQMREASPVIAARSFDEVKARFAQQKPLIELDDDGDFLRSNIDRERPADPPPPLDAMHVMVYDPDDGKVVNVSIPWWILRLQKGESVINLNGRDMNLDDLKITIEDLERLGPTLIVDHKSPRGDRVLVWSQ
jgi:hypothetical protein